MNDQRIKASAPGKIVLTGEYAVLAGAPALVAAVDRRVTCRLAVRQQGGWRFASTGFASDETFAKADVFRAPPTTIAGVARQVLAEADAPAHLEIAIDSSACYRHGHKLGVGSSAATVTALAVALRALRGEAPALRELIDIHRDFQGGGSGLDVAASFTGGVIRYQHRRAAPAHLPSGLAKQVIFCGEGTATAERLAAFDAWRNGGTPAALQRLAEAAEVVAQRLNSAEEFAQAFADYADALARFDRAADLGIFGPHHQHIRDLATRAGVSYKPCGAGGNDIGLAFATNANAMAHFDHAVRAAGLAAHQRFEPVAMGFSTNGAQVRSCRDGADSRDHDRGSRRSHG